MSPTYWSSTQIIIAAEQHGWKIRPIVKPGDPWTILKDGVRIQIKERRDGGLAWVSLGRNMSTRYDNAKLDGRVVGKLAIVLAWLSGDFEAHRRVTQNMPAV